MKKIHWVHISEENKKDFIYSSLEGRFEISPIYSSSKIIGFELIDAFKKDRYGGENFKINTLKIGRAHV